MAKTARFAALSGAKANNFGAKAADSVQPEAQIAVADIVVVVGVVGVVAIQIEIVLGLFVGFVLQVKVA